MLKKTYLLLASALSLILSMQAQVNVTADRTISVGNSGANPDSSDFYAQFSGGNFDSFGMAEFAISKDDFGGATITAVNTLTLRLTINDRTFATAGAISVLFTTDSAADLSGTTDYDTLAFNSNETNGIDLSVFTDTPVVVATPQVDTSVGASGTIDIPLSLATIGTDFVDAINAGDSVHFLIGAPFESTVATFSGVGNTFDPGDPVLVIDADVDEPTPEPAAYPTNFSANASTRDITLSWTDTPEGVIGYVLLASTADNITAPTDGTTITEDLDLSDGSGALVVTQGTESAVLSLLAENTEYFFSIFPYSNFGSAIDYKTDGTFPSSATTTSSFTTGDIIITQYYEGNANNKYIELTNVSNSSIDMSSYVLAAWSNESAEEWKTSGGSTTRTSNFTGITIPAGASIVVADPNASTPIASASADVSNGGSTFFNGNDAVVLYASRTLDPTAIIDVIPFTNEGFEGAEVSFIRLLEDAGYDFEAGTSVLDFPTIWQDEPTADVDSAVFGEDLYLGSSALGSPPPAVSFSGASILVQEDTGTVELTLEIRNPDGNEVTFDVVYQPGESTTELSDISNYTTQSVSFGASAADGDTETVAITVDDDAVEESTETAIFSIENLSSSGSAVVASPSSVTLSIQDNDTPIPNIFISEIVDPGDNAGDGRYVELYNPTSDLIDLDAGNWNFIIYFNANTSGTDIPLTGSIPAGGTYIIAESSNFGAVYESTQEETVGNINSNGDDNFELRFGGGQATGVLVDVYGSPGTVGVGEAWEFGDSRAVRLSSVTEGTITWNAAEWGIIPANVADASPREHPETITLSPSDISATTQSDTEVSLAFTTVDSNDAVIIFNETGIFTKPSGVVPAVGEAFAGGTVLYTGQVSPVDVIELTPETQYYFGVFSVSGTNFSNVVIVDATTEATPLTGVLNTEDFEDAPGDAEDWFNATVTGDDPWDFSEQDAFIDGATSSNADEHYLVSPSFDFSTRSGLTITFEYAGGFDVGDFESLELVYSTNYSGSGNPEANGVTWSPVSFEFTNIIESATLNSNRVSSGQVAFPEAIDGESSVFIAFRYNSDGTIANSEQWFIDNIIVQASASTQLDDYLSSRSLTAGDLGTDTNNNGYPVIIEYLSGFGDEVGLDVIEFGIVTNGSTEVALVLTNDLESIPDGITVELLATSDLTDAFEPVSYTRTEVLNGDGTYTHSYTETTPPGDETRFLRLRVTAD